MKLDPDGKSGVPFSIRDCYHEYVNNIICNHRELSPVAGDALDFLAHQTLYQ